MNMPVKEFIDDHIYATQESNFRYHLGASVIGSWCDREIWYGYRWFREVKHEPRIVRLFGRGHKEEIVVLKYLRDAGISVFETSPDGHQFRLTALGGHFGGSLDGILSDLPDLDCAALFECKTCNEKSFKGLIKSQSVRKDKPEHYVQMQLYMKAYGLKYALYIAVSKNNDDWYWEYVAADDYTSDNYTQRAANIIASDKPPQKGNNNPGWYQCKWCDYHEICHGGARFAINCRTCAHSNPGSDGRWHCEILPTYKIRTNEEAKERNKSINHMPCSGFRYEAIINK